VAALLVLAVALATASAAAAANGGFTPQFAHSPNTHNTNTVYYDGADFARQIGMLPPRDSALDRGVLTLFNTGTRLRQRFTASRSKA